MADPETGARIGRWRRRRGLSQVALAGLVGRSESWLSQVERGVRGVDSLVVLRDLARVLRVDLDDLAPGSTASSPRMSQPVGGDIERALFALRAGDPTSASEIADVHVAYQNARYAEVFSGLPHLMAQLAAVGDPRLSAAGWAVVAKTLTKIGSDDLALVAAERARAAAWRSGDRADLGMAVYQVVCALLPTRRAEVAEELAVQTAEDLDATDDAVRSVSGGLLLIAAVAAARRGDADAAAERLASAQLHADALGRDANLRWSAFGPTNVALHRVSVAAELGDAPAALVAAADLDPSRFAPALRSRRAQVGLDLAWIGRGPHPLSGSEKRRHPVMGIPLTLVVCGAPLASRARDVQGALIAAGWSVALLPSGAASSWVGVSDVERPRPAAVVACPLTFNTANKLVAGIMDTPASGALCDAVGAQLPVVVVPMANTRLWGHPTWAATLTTLHGWGVTLVDPVDGHVGEPCPITSGTGDAVAAAFDPQWIITALGAAPSCG